MRRKIMRLALCALGLPMGALPSCTQEARDNFLSWIKDPVGGESSMTGGREPGEKMWIRMDGEYEIQPGGEMPFGILVDFLQVGAYDFAFVFPSGTEIEGMIAFRKADGSWVPAEEAPFATVGTLEGIGYPGVAVNIDDFVEVRDSWQETAYLVGDSDGIDSCMFYYSIKTAADDEVPWVGSDGLSFPYTDDGWTFSRSIRLPLSIDRNEIDELGGTILMGAHAKVPLGDALEHRWVRLEFGFSGFATLHAPGRYSDGWHSSNLLDLPSDLTDLYAEDCVYDDDPDFRIFSGLLDGDFLDEDKKEGFVEGPDFVYFNGPDELYEEQGYVDVNIYVSDVRGVDEEALR